MPTASAGVYASACNNDPFAWLVAIVGTCVVIYGGYTVYLDIKEMIKNRKNK